MTVFLDMGEQLLQDY